MFLGCSSRSAGVGGSGPGPGVLVWDCRLSGRFVTLMAGLFRLLLRLVGGLRSLFGCLLLTPLLLLPLLLLFLGLRGLGLLLVEGFGWG